MPSRALPRFSPRRCGRPALTALTWLALGLGAAACKGCGCSSPVAVPDAATGATSATSVGAASTASAPLPPSIPHARVSTDRIRPRLRACFAQQIMRNPSTSTSTIEFAFVVDADGGVTSATVKRQDGLDEETLRCMTEAAQGAVFDKPLDGMPATVHAPFTFHAMHDAGGPARHGATPVPADSDLP